MPDATGLELLAQELLDASSDSVIGTTHFRGKGAIEVRPEAIRPALEFLRGKGFTFLASVHGLDYYPEEPRLGVQQLLGEQLEAGGVRHLRCLRPGRR